MVRINKIITAVVIFFALLILLTNLLFTRSANNIRDKYYMVEINRAYSDIVKNDYNIDIDLSGYDYIKDIAYLPVNAGSEEIKRFFENGNESYIIKTISDNDVLGYIKFTYISDYNEEYRAIRIAVNVCLIVMSITVIVILLYIKRMIVNPFNEIRELPYELSKGHLTKNLKENKSRFFGRFIWGLDMLRENLEDHKLKELTLVKEKKTMVLSLSHDIKTPLSAIKLYTKALLENLYEDEEKRRNIVWSIDEKADEIETFVNDIIGASKEDFLHIEVKNSEFYLEELMQRLERYYSDKLMYLKCEFIIDTFQNCLIYGDIERSLEMFENIIENALKYGDGKNITISFDREEDCQLIMVKNTGNTLPVDEIIHIFNSFWRGSNVKDKKGNGLGLYICRQILFKMKGDIFANVENQNMCITVVLKMI